MTYAFLFTLIGGTVVFSLLMVIKKCFVPRVAYNLYNASMATIILGFIVHGICDIAGTGTSLFIVYIIISAVLAFISVIAFIAGK